MSIRLTTLSLILAVAACTPTVSPSAETSPTVTQSAIDTAYWTEQPYCSGRYQLRLPSKRRHGSTHLDYNGWSVMVMFNDWDRNVRTINRFKRSGYDGTDIVVDTRTLIPDRTMMQVTRRDFEWEHIIRDRGMPYEADLYFKLDNDDAYIVRSYFRIPSDHGKAPANWKTQEKEAINTMEKKFRQEILNGLKTRQEFEVPNKHGICLIGGFIADDGKKPFEVHSTVEFAKQHDMSLEIMHGDVLKAGEATLLKRKVDPEKGLLVKALTHTIRQGKRTINGMSGEEKLVKWGGNKYMFFWERDGGDPRIMMQFGAEKKDGTKRSEAEVLAIWDTVLPTLKPVKQ
ncbi:T6SS immunity protein Tli4 family protein [Neisseria sicca]|uniref:T6SS immunity protein Tli4 family protein n=1 Tax=Neisseria sicca TaxID=490 RepID=UPI0028EC9C6B|nr:T6SS immunity protein Tli4 family protein [Neisseria sicca]